MRLFSLFLKKYPPDPSRQAIDSLASRSLGPCSNRVTNQYLVGADPIPTRDQIHDFSLRYVYSQIYLFSEIRRWTNVRYNGAETYILTVPDSLQAGSIISILIRYIHAAS